MKKSFLAVALAAPMLAQALGPNLVVNGDFEQNVDIGGSGLSYIFADVSAGWTLASNGLEIRRDSFGTAHTGSYFAELDVLLNSSISQIINLTPGQYELSFFYSARPGAFGPGANNGLLATWANSAEEGQFRVLTAACTAGCATNNQWQSFSTNFLVATPGPTTLAFSAIGTSDGMGHSLDSISLRAVPEPGSMALIAAGLGVIGFVARRRGQRV